MAQRRAREPVVELQRLSTGYPGQRGRADAVITQRTSASLRSGELTCLLGPNGAGKSTLMRTIAGMQPPLSGTVSVAGRDLRHTPPAELARIVSVVLTDRVTASMLSAYALVALGRHPHTDWLGRLRRADHTAIRQAMALTGAAELAGRLVSELSDGERQRVMIARALAQESPIMLLDEITAFLDLPRRVEMMSMLRELAHETGRAILLSTHDLDLALRASDCIWLLPKAESIVVGAPEDLVLSGAFESVFASEGVRFEAHAGSFHIRSARRGRVAVDGSGLARVWTVRALERVGYHAVETDASVRVAVRQADGIGTSWLIDEGDRQVACSSIEQLIDELRAAARGGDHGNAPRRQPQQA